MMKENDCALFHLIQQTEASLKYNYLNTQNAYGIKMDPNVISTPQKALISLPLVKYS